MQTEVEVTHESAHTRTYTHVGFVSSDAMRLMDGGRERKDGQMNLICLNAGEVVGPYITALLLQPRMYVSE